MSRNRLADAGTGTGGAAYVFGDNARGYALGRVAALTSKLVSWRSFAGKDCELQKHMGEMAPVEELVEFMGCYCVEKGNKESTIVGKLVGTIFHREQLVGLAVSLGNPLIWWMRQAIKRVHAEKASQLRVRRPLTWEMLTGMHDSVPSWGKGRRAI